MTRRWTLEQERAMRLVEQWIRSPGPQVFRLFGYAGTGKTTLARALVADDDGRWLFAAYTGKAASVMRTKGCHGAQTIHSLIYQPYDTPDGGVGFRVREDSPLWDARGVVVDEASMVDRRTEEDLLSFDKKILVCGDPAQLSPVGDAGSLGTGDPDVLLTEVHRQASESGILDLATFVRSGGDPSSWAPHGDDCEVWDRSRVASADVWRRMLVADQVICGTNQTRHRHNQHHRKALGVAQLSPLPIAGDRLVCLRNDRSAGLLNGSTWYASEVSAGPAGRDDTVSLVVAPDEADGRQAVSVVSWTHHFLAREHELLESRRRWHQEFDFGYHVTAHKAQGSQWPSVVVFDESRRFRPEDRFRWLYTAITRASERLLVVV